MSLKQKSFFPFINVGTGGKVKAGLITIMSHLQNHKLLNSREGGKVLNRGNLFSETRPFLSNFVMHITSRLFLGLGASIGHFCLPTNYSVKTSNCKSRRYLKHY